MKIKRTICGFVLAFSVIFGVFGLSGCGDISIKTLSENFKQLEEEYQSYTTVFKSGTYEDVATKYMISYGITVDTIVANRQEEYVDLLDSYNALLIISNNYIDNNKLYILNLDEKDLSKDSKESLKDLNESLENYINYIGEFVKDLNTMKSYFAQFSSSNVEDATNEASLAHLRRFKKSYGELIDKSIELSMSLANSVESTQIFELLKNSETTVSETKIMKEYIGAKMLPIYSQFLISEIGNKLNWDAQAETETKTRIDTLLNELKSSLNGYKNVFIKEISLKKLETKEMKKLFEMLDSFTIEADAYIKALKELNISSLAIDFDNDLEEYKGKKPLAEVYLNKIEQFISNTLGNFTDEVLDMIQSN